MDVVRNWPHPTTFFMKYLIALFLSLTTELVANSQSLTGIWEGWFLSAGRRGDTAIMKLEFRLKSDSSYEVYSFTKDGDFKAVCKMSYKLLSKYSIYLEEVEMTRKNKPYYSSFFQKMQLDIEKDFKTMTGRWSFTVKLPKGNGKIYFRKKE